MAYAVYTKELAFKAAEELTTEGIRPTITNVRERMGGGSPNDVTKWMREFNARQQQVAIAQQVPIPEPIQTAANDLLNQLLVNTWDTARAAANDKLIKDRQTLEEDRLQLESETAEALEQAENLYQENETLKELAEKSASQYQESIQIIDKLTQDVEKKLTQITTLQASEIELKAKLAELLSVIETAKEDKRINDIKAAKITGAFNEISKQRDSLVKTNESLAKELELCKVQIQSQHVMLDTKTQQITEFKAELADTRIETKKANTQAAELNGELKSAFNEIKRLREQIETIHKVSTQQNNQIKKPNTQEL